MARRRPGDLGQSLHDASRPRIRRARGARFAPGDDARCRLDLGSGGIRETGMSEAITLDMLRAASSAEFPVIDLGAYMGGDAGALGSVAAQLRDALHDIGF